MDPEIDRRARTDVQSTLSMVPHFATMSSGDQLDLYRQLVGARASELERRANGGKSEAMLLGGLGGVAGGIGGLLGGGGGGGLLPGANRNDAKRASELIDEGRHTNKRIDQLGDIASDFIDAVSFPTFVSDLLDGVFKANLKVTKDQMVAYQELLKAATQSLAFFMKKIPPQESFAYLAANDDDNFSVNFPLDDGPAELTDKDGNVVAKAGEETDDAVIKAKIMDATLAMAKEQRAMLREILLMGVTRLVVEKGVIRASVKFDFKATENVDRQDKAMVQDTRSTSDSVAHSGGFFGSIFGGPQAGTTSSTRHAQLSVATTKSDNDTSVTANLQGFVEITFKSDYFRLDNFATMYGPAAAGPAPAAPGGLAPAPLPAAPAAPPAAPGQGQ